MALRAVLEHPKFARLKAKLKLSRWEVLGLLEAVWHFTGRFTPRGDIGKYSNEEIAAWVEYQGDADELINALIAAKWIDPCVTHRLVVHDWHQHADAATKLSLKRSESSFIVATVSQQCQDGVATVLGLPVPVPVPVPVPEPVAVDFKHPTEKEVQDYATSIGKVMDSERFVDYYSSQHWKTKSGDQLKNWQLAVRNWIKRDEERNGKPSGIPPKRPPGWTSLTPEQAALVQR